MHNRIQQVIRCFILLIWLVPPTGDASFTGDSAGGPTVNEVTVLQGATLIDGRGGPIVTDSVVVTSGDQIIFAGASGQAELPADARVIDLKGKFLLPGFIDVHAHITLDKVDVRVVDGVPSVAIEYNEDTSRGLLSNLLADGITGIRNPGGSAQIAVALRRAISTKQLPGPDIVTAGELLSATAFEGLTTTVTDEPQIAAEISRQASVGVDLIKIYYDLPENLLAFAIKTAHGRGLPAIAHTGPVSWTRVAQLSIDGLVHIMPISPELLGATAQQQFLSNRRPGTFEFFEWYEVVDLESPEIRKMATELAAKEVFIDPTLVMFEAIFWGDDSAITNNSALARVPPHLVDNWRNYFNMNIGWTPEDFSRAKAVWPKVLQLSRLLFEAGVPLAIGSDLGNPWIVPGDSFHRELALMVDAGIPPLDVITMATLNGAKFMGSNEVTGTVEPGKLANLVILNDDPVANITNSRKISNSMYRGALLNPADLLILYEPDN